MYLVEHEPAECHQTLLYNEWRFVHARINSAYIYKTYIYIYIYGPRSEKTGLYDKHFDFRFSTFSINDIYYDLNAKRTMSLTLLIA